MFSLDRAKVKIVAVTAVSELHGSERKPACCITFEMTASNSYLSEFHELLRSCLYSRETQPNRQANIDIDDDADGLTNLRFPQMGAPIKWDWDGAGYEATLHIGPSGKGDIELTDVDLKNFAFTPKDGGSCIYKFQAMTHPTAKDQGQIDQMLQSETELTLIPPTADAGLFDDDRGPAYNVLSGTGLAKSDPVNA